MSVLESFLKVTLSWSMTKIKTPWGEGKFNPMWYGPFIIKQVLEKGLYELIHFEGNKLVEPRNRLYLKKYFA